MPVPNGRRTLFDQFVIACKKLIGLAKGIEEGSINKTSKNWDECIEIGDGVINEIMAYIYDIPSEKATLVQQFGYYLNMKDIAEIKLECEKELLHQELDASLKLAQELKIKEQEEVLKTLQEEEDVFWNLVKDELQNDSGLMNSDGYENNLGDKEVNIHQNLHTDETRKNIEKLNKLWLID